jgi:hypothetical protein
MPQLTQEEMQELFFYQSFCATAMPLNLDLTCSINLSKVTRYEPLEKTKTVIVGKGDNAHEEEQGTGEFEPAVFFEGGEYIVLTKEQNKIFRNIWAIYARASHMVFALGDRLFPKTELPAEETTELVQ